MFSLQINNYLHTVVRRGYFNIAVCDTVGLIEIIFLEYLIMFCFLFLIYSFSKWL